MLIDLTMFQNILVLYWILSFPKILMLVGRYINKYEKEIIDYYGVNRDGTDMPTKYMELKNKL